MSLRCIKCTFIYIFFFCGVGVIFVILIFSQLKTLPNIDKSYITCMSISTLYAIVKFKLPLLFTSPLFHRSLASTFDYYLPLLHN